MSSSLLVRGILSARRCPIDSPTRRNTSPEQAEKFAGQMIGHKLITKQTGAAGRVCNAIMLAERRNPTPEYYVAILNDRGLGGPALVASRQGGMKSVVAPALFALS